MVQDEIHNICFNMTEEAMKIEESLHLFSKISLRCMNGISKYIFKIPAYCFIVGNQMERIRILNNMLNL